MTRTGLILFAIHFAPVFMFAPAFTWADVVHYGDFAGVNVSFNGVQESSSNIGNGAGQVPALYGQPVVLGNELRFNPADFEAMSLGFDNVITDGQLSLTLVADPGFYISQVSFIGNGVYTLSTPFANGQALASSSLFGLGTASSEMQSGTESFQEFSDNANSIGTFGQLWAEELTLDFGNVTEIDFDFNNTLNAASTAGSSAFIKSERIIVRVELVPIPEPAAGLPAMIVAACAVARRKRT